MNLDFTYRLLSSAKTLPETIKKSRQMLAMSSAPDADAPHELEFTSQAYDTFDLPAQGAVKVHHDLFNHQSGGVRFTRGRKQIALVSTHQPEQAVRIGEEVLLLADGKLIESGTVDQVINHPTTEIGRMYKERKLK